MPEKVNRMPKPSYTQVPNLFLDLMPDMSEAEMKVMCAAIGKLFGKKREGLEPINLTQFQQATDLSIHSVLKGIDEATTRGWLQLVDYDGPEGTARYWIHL